MADRAVLWLEEVIASHGTTDGPGRVRIPLSQAALARATARSAGTVTYYVRCLGPLIERRDGVLIVDIAALAERRDNRRGRRAEVADQLTRRFDQATADGSTIELVDGDGPPTVREMAQEVGLAPSLVQRHLHALETDGRAARHGRYLTLASEATENVASSHVASDAVAGLSAAVASLADTACQLTDLAQQLLTLAQSEAGPTNICAVGSMPVNVTSSLSTRTAICSANSSAKSCSAVWIRCTTSAARVRARRADLRAEG